jgi:hypothetical protein
LREFAGYSTAASTGFTTLGPESFEANVCGVSGKGKWFNLTGVPEGNGALIVETFLDDACTCWHWS